MELKLMPHAVAWIGRCVAGLPLLHRLIRGIPSLCKLSWQCKTCCGKEEDRRVLKYFLAYFLGLGTSSYELMHIDSSREIETYIILGDHLLYSLLNHLHFTQGRTLQLSLLWILVACPCHHFSFRHDGKHLHIPIILSSIWLYLLCHFSSHQLAADGHVKCLHIHLLSHSPA